MRFFLLTLFFLLSCGTEPLPESNISEIKNTKDWVITSYTINGVKQNLYQGYIFNISDNPKVGCADWFDGICDYGVFGGYIDIIDNNQKYRVNILLPEIWNLQNITGFWDVIVINGNTIHLIRVRVTGKEEIYFKRF